MECEKLPRRLAAYLIDIIVLFLILFLVRFFMRENPNIKILNIEINSINELAFKHDIGLSTYLIRYAAIVQDLDRQNVFIHLVNLLFIIIYFIVLPYFMKGSTMGKKIMKLKVVRRDGKKLTLKDLLIRSLIMNGLCFLIVGLLLLYFVPSIAYLILTVILGILQIILVFVSLFMIIYRKDNRGLHDIISATGVVREN